MIKRLSAVVFGLVIAGWLGLATAPSAQASAQVSAPVRCIGNWVNAPCIGPEAKAPTMASRVVTPVAAPRVAAPRCTGPNPPLSAS